MQRVSESAGTAENGRQKNTICNETARLCLQEFGPRLRAVVLTGSLARDEATFLREATSSTLLGDAEFLVVLHEWAGLPAASAVDVIRQKLQEVLARAGTRCQITLTTVRPLYLQKLRPHIFAYELRTCGQVIWGEAQILGLIPSFSPTEIPLEDGWRLLCNRIIEELDAPHEVGSGREVSSHTLRYRTVKLYLDMATSLLLFAGAYAPTYRERATRLQRLADAPGTEEWPFALPAFARTVSACTRWKLCPSAANGAMGGEFCRVAHDYARRLHQWELARLTGADRRLSDRALFDRWTRLEPLHRRLRGWAYVLRKQGWHRSWRHWGRWVRLAWRASPRYQVYAVATELFARLPDLMGANQHGPLGRLDLQALRDDLPLRRRSHPQNGDDAWSHLAADIAWNYRAFLVDTRA